MKSVAQKYPESYALCQAANEAANRAQTVWLGFLSFGTFLVVAVAGTTHRMMFQETPISLPILSINLDLVSFYIAAPILLWVLHFYLIVKLVLLAETFANFEWEVEQEIKTTDDRRQMLKHLNTTIFLQALRQGWRGRRIIAALLVGLLFLTVVVTPLVALSFTLIRFLPYQSEFVTSLHRVLLLVDVVVFVLAYESVLRVGTRGRPVVSRWVRWLAYPPAAVLITVSWLLFHFPGECWIERRPSPLDSLEYRLCLDNNMIALALLPAAMIGDQQTTSIHGYFPTVLALANEDFVDDLRIDLDKVDATEIRPRRSFVKISLRNADLREAVFDGSDMRAAALSGARLQGAVLDYAQLQGAFLIEAQLQGASLFFSQLQGGQLDGVQLQGALLRNANLQGAELGWAKLHGASLDHANLQGAELDWAEFQAASLGGAKLQGAVLDRAQLQGAVLDAAQLQGASLDGAQLQGASLDSAQLQGASLDDAELQRAWLSEAFLWRAVGLSGSSVPAVLDPELAPVVLVLADRDDNVANDWIPLSLSEANVQQLIEGWLADVPEGEMKNAARKRLEQGLAVDGRTQQEDLATVNRWRQAAERMKMETVRHQAWQAHITEAADAIEQVACGTDLNSSSALRRIAQGIFSADASRGPTAARLILDPERCPGGEALNAEVRANLKRIASEVEREPDTSADAVAPPEGDAEPGSEAEADGEMAVVPW